MMHCPKIRSRNLAATILLTLVCLTCAASLLKAADEALFPDDVRDALNRANEAVIHRDGAAIREMSVKPDDEAKFMEIVEEIFDYLPEGEYVQHELVGLRKNWIKTNDESKKTYLPRRVSV